MNTLKTRKLVEQLNVVTLRADKTRSAPEIDQLLVELGNTAVAIPYLAIFPGNGGAPIVLENIVTQQQVLNALKEAGPSATAGGEVLTVAPLNNTVLKDAKRG